MRTSDSDGDEDNNWNEELLRAINLRVGKLAEDPEGTRLSLIKEYLNEGANIDVQDANGDTVLHLAVKRGFRRIVELLRQRGAKTDIYNDKGETAIGLAGTLQKKDIVSILQKSVEQRHEPKFSPSSGANNFMSAVDEDMNIEVGSLTTIGVNSLYCEQMKEYDVHFKSEMQRVKAFLTADQSYSAANQILELVAPGETFLTALRVYDTLERIQKYKKMDSFIFTRVDRLKFPSILNLIKNTSDSLRCPNLLIIDCGSNGTDQYLRTMWNSLCKIIDESLYKKMIVITRTGEDLGTQFKCGHETYREKNIDLGFRNLTNATQKKLLEKPVTKFQGHENKTSLGELLGICKFDHLSADELEDLLEIIDANALVEIIRSDQLELGDDLAEMDIPKHCYINRTICREVFNEEAILEYKNIPDLIAISGTDAVLQDSRPRIGENFPMRRNFSTELFPEIGIDRDSSGRSGNIGESQPMDNRPTNFTTLDSPEAEKQFNEFCAKNVGRNIHPMRLSEDQLISHDKPVIISDAAGMGKSTMLTHLAHKIKENKPDMLVLKVDLNDHSTALSEVMEKSIYDLGITDGAIQFLVEELLGGETDLSRKVFRRIIKSKHKVALIFDGFDEISPTYEGPVIDLLKTFADYGIKKLLIATRPHTRATLETKLDTCSYVIQPFSKYDQRRFFTKFWKQIHTADDRVKKYTRALTNKLADSITDRRNKLTGNPLQAQLVAEIFGNSCKEFVDSEVDEPQFPEKIDLIYLYENFVGKKLDVFSKKKYGNCAKPAVMEDEQQRRESLSEEHVRLALYTLFDKEEITKLLLASDMPHEPADLDIQAEGDGIITQFIDDLPCFGHQTYAEYIAAKFFSDMLTMKKCRQTELLGKIFVADILLGENFNTMRALIDGFLSDKHVLQGEFWALCLKTHRSQQQETIFHVAAAEGNGRIMRLFLNCSYANTEDRRDLIQAKDSLGRTAVHRAVEYGNLDNIKLLTEDTDVEIVSRDIWGCTPLHQATHTVNIDVMKYLVRKGAEINCQTNDGVTPLHLAAGKGKLAVVKYLHRNKADINCQTNDGVTPLHLAALEGRLDIVKYLHGQGADINCQTNDGRKLLHLAARAGELDVVKYLHDEGADINCQTNDGVTPLDLAARVGESDVVKYLHGKGAQAPKSCHSDITDTSL